MKNSVFDGSAYAVMAGLTQNYITPYALTMKATTQQVGLLSSIPNFTMALVQLFAPIFSERLGSRKKLILPMVFMHALMFLPMLLIPHLFRTNQVSWLIAFHMLGTAFDAVSNPAWGSMMADLVPEELRGRFFGGRNLITGLVGMAFSFVAGGILQALTGNTTLAFTIILSGAIIARLSTIYFLANIDEPVTPVIDGRQRTSLLKIAGTLFSTNIGQFTIFHALVNFAAALAGPFFTPYMLRELNFSYITYTIVNAASGISTIFFMMYWGKRTDRAGNIQVLKITSFLIPFVPVFWLVSRNLGWILFVQVFAGFSWAGFQLAASVFIFDVSPQDNRTRHLALFNTLTFLGASLGSLIGGVIGPHLPAILGSYFLTIFLVSGLARLLVVLTFIPRLKEVRDVPKIGTRELLVGEIHPRNINRWPQDISNGLGRLRGKK